MTIINCHECKAEISSEAKTCPKCGAKVPRVKWWLWIPLGIFGVIMLIGWNTPRYKSVAREVRDICLKAFPLEPRQCNEEYDRAIAEGQRLRKP